MKKILLFASFALLAMLNARADDIKVVPGETFTLEINLDNANDVCAWQATVALPEGIELVKANDSYAVSLSPRHGNSYSLIVRPVAKESNQYLLVAFSPSLKALEGHSGSVATLTLRASKEYKGSSVLNVIGQTQGNKRGEGTTTADKAHVIIADATGIDTVNASYLQNREVYTLSGQRVSKLSKGVYVVDGKKVFVK